MKTGTPERGPAAIPPIVAAGTLLCLWFRELKKGGPTVEQAQEVLDPLKQRDRNPKRGLANREWLQLRGENIVLKPTKVEDAKIFGRKFCLQEWDSE